MSTTGGKKKKTIKNTHIWSLNNMLLNNQQITEETKIFIETMKMKTQKHKTMGLSKSSAKGKVHNNMFTSRNKRKIK